MGPGKPQRVFARSELERVSTLPFVIDYLAKEGAASRMSTSPDLSPSTPTASSSS